jgi:hypothetical protein
MSGTTKTSAAIREAHIHTASIHTVLVGVR